MRKILKQTVSPPTPLLPRIFFLRFQLILFIPVFLTKNTVLGKYKGIWVKYWIRSWQAFEQGASADESCEVSIKAI